MTTILDDITKTQTEVSQELAEVAERLRRSTVLVREPRGHGAGGGSGVIWQSDGLVVTNAHVARGRRAGVELWDGRRLDAAVEARDPQRDVAVLRAEARGLPAAEIRDSNGLRPGELVLAVGNPLGMVGALSTGIISAVAVGRGPGDESPWRGWIQADVRLAPGNSGGPLADAGGRVVGINSMVAGGLALAVPSNAVADLLGRRHEPAPPRHLGVTIAPVLVRQSGARAFGLIVLEVEPAGLAEVAGLRMGDVLIGANGKPFEGPYDLARALNDSARAGGRAGLRLELVRAGGRLTCDVRLSQATVESKRV
jgi:serine protease Do